MKNHIAAIAFGIFSFAIDVVLIFIGLYVFQKNYDCDRVDGVAVRAVFGYVCIDKKAIKVLK